MNGDQNNQNTIDTEFANKIKLLYTLTCLTHGMRPATTKEELMEQLLQNIQILQRRNSNN